MTGIMDLHCSLRGTHIIHRTLDKLSYSWDLWDMYVEFITYYTQLSVHVVYLLH